MRLRGACHDQSDQVAGYGTGDGEPALVRAVAELREDDHHEEGQEAADGGEGVGGGAVEAEGPVVVSVGDVIVREGWCV